MNDTDDFIRSLGARVAAVLPPGLPDTVRENVQDLVRGALSRMDVVSRQEFEIQAAHLERAQARLASLEERIARLEDPSRPDTTSTD